MPTPLYPRNDMSQAEHVGYDWPRKNEDGDGMVDLYVRVVRNYSGKDPLPYVTSVQYIRVFAPQTAVRSVVAMYASPYQWLTLPPEIQIIRRLWLQSGPDDWLKCDLKQYDENLDDKLREATREEMIRHEQ